jgi:hypothetical protein
MIRGERERSTRKWRRNEEENGREETGEEMEEFTENKGRNMGEN